MPGFCRLKGTIKHYDWGGNEFIPTLLKIDNADNLPFAEYWLGAHVNDHCTIVLPDGRIELLKEFLDFNTELLGSTVKNKFGHLPYLLKVLDVHKMLSIQVHPSKAAAEKEFARENDSGIALDADNRCYKDDNHKPELMVALSDFWLLHGFKPTEELIDTLQNVSELQSLLPIFKKSGYEGLYHFVMTMPQEEVNSILKPLLDNLRNTYKDELPKKSEEDYWVLKAANQFSFATNIDRGIFSIYFFNLIHLKVGEAIFQPAGVPHAYLEGQNVEIMASSDNVLRGGLTTKHINVNELLKHVKCEPTYVKIISAEGTVNTEQFFPAETKDFQLSLLDISAKNELLIKPTSAEILLLTEGKAKISDGTNEVLLVPGSPAAIIFPGYTIKIVADETSMIFRASVPVD